MNMEILSLTTQVEKKSKIKEEIKMHLMRMNRVYILGVKFLSRVGKWERVHRWMVWINQTKNV